MLAQHEFTYDVEVLPKEDKFKVTLNLPDEAANAMTFLLPAWAPGSYKLLDFGQWLDSIRAFDKYGKRLKVRRISVNRWDVENVSGALSKIEYVMSDIPEDSVETLPTSLNNIDENYAYINGPSLFGYLLNHKEVPCRVNYLLPENWNAWCALDSTAPTSFSASNYDQLVDCPVIAGGEQVETYRFEQDDRQYVFVVNSNHVLKMDSIIALTKPVLRYHIDLFGEAPFDTYYFLFNFFIQGTQYGALEHVNSSAYYLPPFFRRANFRRNIYVPIISHEFFHLWSPKRFYPEGLGPFEYQEPVKLESMWFIEGITEYYANLALLKSGVISTRQYLSWIKKLVSFERQQNLVKLSLDSPNLGVPEAMYKKGALIGLLLDIKIRYRTQNAQSLDDVVRHFNTHFAKRNRQFSDTDVIEIMKESVGLDFKKFRVQYIEGSKPIPFEKFFRKSGLIFERVYPAFLGWNLELDDMDKLYVGAVASKSTASDLGLNLGDIILDVNEIPVPEDIDDIVAFIDSLTKLKVGTDLTFRVLREGEELKLVGKVRAAQSADLKLVANPNIDSVTKQISKALYTRK